jgi:predicted transcriptional regulator of viral defense system
VPPHSRAWSRSIRPTALGTGADIHYIVCVERPAILSISHTTYSTALGHKDELAELARRSASGIVTAEAAAIAWHKDSRAASKRLAALARGGWLRRVRRGTYQIAALEASSSTVAPYEDPWTLAGAVFAPCYIGGWSAAEHWGLTEQLFRETFVVTAASVRSTHTTVGGLAFRLARVSRGRAVGDATVWRRTAQVTCSSPERTLIDGGNSPAWIGGVRHLAEVVARYAEHPSRDLKALAQSLKEYGRGSGAKRLGFLAERLVDGEHDEQVRETLLFIRDVAVEHRTAGVVKLDPGVRSRGHMNTAWGLWVNAEVVRRDHA